MKRVLLPLALAASVFSGGAFAQNYGGYNSYDDGYGREGYDAGYDYAEVVSVDPLIDVVNRPVQRDECWQEPVTYREPVRYYESRPRSHAPAVLGGIIGGLVGNQFGGGRGRDAATVAGAALGYAAVRDSQRHYGGGGYYNGGREYTSYEQRCATRTQYVSDEQVNGYNVTYRYNDRLYQTVTDYHPGNTIRVRVDVSAAP